MARREPLQQADLALLSGYGFYLFIVFVWLCLIGVSLQRTPAEWPFLEFVVRKAPPILVFVQGLFYLLATQFRPFRQRLMSQESHEQDALVAALVLWGASLLFFALLVE
jgi:hypothetical protein